MNVLLLRTHRFGPREEAFLAQLAHDTGWQAYVLADETRHALPTGAWPKISLTRAAAVTLGLRWVQDAAWRCGDYGFYLARAALPIATRFWMIEPDVRAGMGEYGALFQRLATSTADFLAPGLRESDRAHFWYPTMRWRSPAVYRCHFAFCAMRATAADLCLQERRALARAWPSRIVWPNDETFVVSTLVRCGRNVADFNDVAGCIWTEASFGFFDPQHGETLEQDGLLHHPVLWGADYTAKLERVARGLTVSEQIRLKFLRGVARLEKYLAPRPV